jgi:hypothetical protein
MKPTINIHVSSHGSNNILCDGHMQNTYRPWRAFRLFRDRSFLVQGHFSVVFNQKLFPSQEVIICGGNICICFYHLNHSAFKVLSPSPTFILITVSVTSTRLSLSFCAALLVSIYRLQWQLLLLLCQQWWLPNLPNFDIRQWLLAATNNPPL